MPPRAVGRAAAAMPVHVAMGRRRRNEAAEEETVQRQQGQEAGGGLVCGYSYCCCCNINGRDAIAQQGQPCKAVPTPDS